MLISFSGCKNGADYYTRGVGIYPGNPAEDFSPNLVVDKINYRNLAKLRSAYHSSGYDYNLTAQLVTDGIIIHEMPDFISFSTSQGVLPKNEREWLLDHNSVTALSIEGAEIWIQFELNQVANIPEITGITINGNLTCSDKKPGGWEFVCSGSNDGVNWDELGKVKGAGLPGQERPNPFAKMLADLKSQGKDSTKRRPPNPFAFFSGPAGADSTIPKPSFTFNFRIPRNIRLINQSFEFNEPVAYHFYRVNLSAPCAENWRFGDLDFYKNETKLKMAPSHSFKSAWMSAGTGEEWVYVGMKVTRLRYWILQYVP
ncbi:MAG: hypothetical protein IMY71_09480 [Bacteroidetes bacterium]|nr:hypothetical protein [Bacteroidota bacterium]